MDEKAVQDKSYWKQVAGKEWGIGTPRREVYNTGWADGRDWIRQDLATKLDRVTICSSAEHMREQIASLLFELQEKL